MRTEPVISLETLPPSCHHHICGHGGERLVAGAFVDGFVDPVTRTVFQYHGCHSSGCISCYPGELQYQVLFIDKQGNLGTRRDRYEKTLQREKLIRKVGFELVDRWEHEDQTPWISTPTQRSALRCIRMLSFSTVRRDRTSPRGVTPAPDLLLESKHVPISVSLGDTLLKDTEYIVNKDPDELMELFFL